jgi:hypothetical protein
MKREISRKKTLPAFRIDMAELGLLWERLVALFNDPSRVHGSLTLELPTETLKFANFGELKNHDKLPPTANKFSLLLMEGERHIFIGTSGIVSSKPEVSVGGESEAWCAGAVETAFVFFVQHKASYNWFIAAPIGWLLVLLTYGAGLASSFLAKDVKVPLPAFVGWLSLVVTFTLLYALRAKLFPMTVLSIRNTDGFFRRHVAELTLLVAVVSALLTVIGWFIAK